MLDRLFEDQTFPKTLPLHRFKRPLVLAPHPDDEVFGCGGLMAIWASHGVKTEVVVLTSGEEQGDGPSRQAESLAAAAILGHSVSFWNLQDRGIRCTPDLVQRLVELIEASRCDIVFVPALHEPHPDHQATALALLWSLPQLKQAVEVCFYESGSTLVHCTHVVDITEVVHRKSQAMEVFASQKSAQPYSSRIAARDHFRAMTQGEGSAAAEGYQWVSLAGQGWPALLPALDPLFLHARGQAVLPEDLPLVSVLVRTVGDPALEQAVASVRAQTYPCIELVVVAAHGAPMAPPWLHADMGIRAQWVCRHEKLTRPQAANAALDAASGKYCLFLDDDDLITPGHVEKLVRLLRATPMARAAHTDTQVINADGAEILRYDRPYSASRLVFTNVFPIHSVLFERELVTRNACRYDEELPVLEDWDFWLQVSEHTDFPHVAGLSAIYRYRDRSRLAGDDQHVHHHRYWRSQIAGKWLARLPVQRVGDAGAWYAKNLDDCEQRLEYLRKEHASANQALAAAEQAHMNTQQALAAAEQAQANAHSELAQARQALALIHASRGWKLLQRLRSLKRIFTGTAS